MERKEISRRQVLGWMAASGGAILLGEETGGLRLVGRPVSLVENLLGSKPKPYAPPTSVLLVRAEDGLVLSVSFTNLEVRPRSGKAPQLALKDPNVDGLVVIGLPPQSVLEEAIPQEGPTLPPVQTAPLGALLSGPSRVAVRVPKGTAPVTYDVPGLLQLAGFPLVLPTIADDGVTITHPRTKPGPNETAIEAPARLFLSPRSDAVFSATTTPVTRNGRTELWHARAVLRRPDGSPDQHPGAIDVRAVWTPDEKSPITAPDWATEFKRVPLTAKNRTDIAVNTTESTPAQASLLLLSPLGASLDIVGVWEDRPVTAWRHRAYLGRDTYVKIEEPGYLFPFGFAATRISITERIIEKQGIAVLRKQQFIEVRRPSVVFSDPQDPNALAPGMPNAGRGLPFTQARTTTLVTPPLANPSEADVQWVQVRDDQGAATLLPYHLELRGQDGKVVTAQLPAAFMVDSAAYRSPLVPEPGEEPFSSFNSDPTKHTLDLAGQRLALAPAGDHPEDPSLPTFHVVLRADRTGVATSVFQQAHRLNGYPALVQADVHVEALDALAAGGPTALVATPPTHPISFDATYLTAGTNKGDVWARMAAAPPKVDVPQDIGGGLAAPAFAVQGLSRAHGPVSDVEQMAAGKFDPKQYFGKGVTLLGGIELTDVIKGIDLPDARSAGSESIPKLVTTRTPQEVTTRIRWQPQMNDVNVGLFTFKPSKAEGKDRLDLEARFVTNLGTGATATSVTGVLLGAGLDFFGALLLPIDRLRFESHDGHAPTLDAQIGTPTFAGDLRFLNALQEYLPRLPGGAKVDVSARGVKAGLTIALPTATVGVVLIENLAIGVELDLPFNGDQATLGMSFATREHPFHVTVMALGGGGFLGIGMGLQGIQRLEGSLEFGASVALDFGVASGSLSIMAGIYFKYAQALDAAGKPKTPAGKTVVITGYVRAMGELSVLGLIHASVEFYLGLSFTKTTGVTGPDAIGKVEGTARLTVRVEVLFFSTSVSVEMHKEFGAGVDPSFGDQISSGDWSRYCAAFAA